MSSEKKSFIAKLKRQEALAKKMFDFVDYVFDFYGEDGIYDMGATKIQIMKSTQRCLDKFGYENFEFDSVDRERVRDIMIDDFGLVFPQ